MSRALPWIALAVIVAVQLGFLAIRSEPQRDPGEASVGSRTVVALERRLERLEALHTRLDAARPDAGSGAGGSSLAPSGEEEDQDSEPELLMQLAELELRLGALEEAEEHDPENLVRDRTPMRALTRALAQGDRAEIERLLAEGIDPNGRDDDKQTPLNAAAIAGHRDLVDLLVEHGADLERTGGRRRMTPLLAALDAVQEEAALHLLDLGADPAAVDKNGESALIWASFNGTEKVVRRLLSLGVDVDFQAHDGSTALADASRRGEVEIARLLLEAGADPNLSDKAGQRALQKAVEEGYHELADLLRAYGAW